MCLLVNPPNATTDVMTYWSEFYRARASLVPLCLIQYLTQITCVCTEKSPMWFITSPVDPADAMSPIPGRRTHRYPVTSGLWSTGYPAHPIAEGKPLAGLLWAGPTNREVSQDTNIPRGIEVSVSRRVGFAPR